MAKTRSPAGFILTTPIWKPQRWQVALSRLPSNHGSGTAGFPKGSSAFQPSTGDPKEIALFLLFTLLGVRNSPMLWSAPTKKEVFSLEKTWLSQTYCETCMSV